MVLATSSGEPSRRRGICLASSSVPGDRMAVSISPGAILYVVLGLRLPWTVFREGLTGAGDHLPAGAGEAFDGRMADAAARAGENECALGGVLLVRHFPIRTHGPLLDSLSSSIIGRRRIRRIVVP